jgi:folylpolyglutamate synthase
VWSAGLATGSTEYEEVLGCLASLITQKVRADTGNRGNQWELMAKYVQVGEAGVLTASVWCVSRCLLLLFLIEVWLCCQILELEESIAQLKVVHVAGTKGKVTAACLVALWG